MFVCPGRSLSRGVSVQGRSLSRGVSVHGRSLSREVSVEEGFCLAVPARGGREVVPVQGVQVQGISVREIPVWLRVGGTHPTGMLSCYN